MEHNQLKLKTIAVLGAAGKMGSGISLLLLELLAKELAQLGKKDRIPKPRLILIDANEGASISLKHYLREHLRKFAEKSINDVRIWYRDRLDLIDNSDMIEDFVEGAFDYVRFGSLLEECQGAHLVFEAIVEDVDIKSKVYKKLNALLSPQAYYFTNTSSIPISVLQEQADIQGRLIGFHFYNPPAVQKLLEIIIPENISSDLQTMAQHLAIQLKKTVVHSHDISGFIGNGHFIREIQFACDTVEDLAPIMGWSEAIYLVNRVTQEFLLRPMGIFQLIDYCGIDVADHIAKIMTKYLPGNHFNTSLINTMLDQKITGGQYPDGSQKDGFFHYEKGSPIAIYNLTDRSYVPCSSDSPFYAKCAQKIGPSVEGCIPWKILSKDEARDAKIKNYFLNLWQQQTTGAELAKNFLGNSQKIAVQLVRDHVADTIEDVDRVLKNGFYHLYNVDIPFSTMPVKGSLR